MKTKKTMITFVCILSIMSSIFCAPSTFAASSAKPLDKTLTKQVIDYAKEQVIDSYSGFYTIPYISASIEGISYENNTFIFDVNVSFKKILHAKSAEDLPYIQGLESKAAKLNGATLETAMREINYKKRELEDRYIGVEQTENSKFRIRIPTISTKSSSESFAMTMRDSFGNEFSMNAFGPSSAEEMFAAGEKAIGNVSLKTMSSNVYHNPRAQEYNRLNARDYARTYALDYNDEWESFKGRGGDCANFVSQCFWWGGLSTDGVWDLYTYAWNYAIGVHNYMRDNNICYETYDKYQAMAGSIISWTNQEHVGLVDQNDTVTMTYCAHTTDVLSESFVNYSNVKFCVPEWDSAYGCWTRE